jgi:drug/metabolite transporter (DMT)-like permease
MMGLHSTGISGTTEVFTKPIFQTFGMFVGMLFGLIMHAIVVAFKIPFPGYDHVNHNEVVPAQKHNTTPNVRLAIETDRLIPPKNARAIVIEKPQVVQPKPDPAATSSSSASSSELPVWMYFFLAVPSIFDLAATVLCMMGLRYLDVSIYQLLRGSGIIFVALMKQHVLKHRLYTFQWTGVVWNVVSVFLVGTTAILNTNSNGSVKNQDPGEALLGVMLVMAGAFVQALQFVFEEKVMTMDIPSPPLLLIGMEGLWGTVLCLFVIYPFAYYLPGKYVIRPKSEILYSTKFDWQLTSYIFARKRRGPQFV